MRFPTEPSMGGLFIEVCVGYLRKKASTSAIYAFLRFRQIASASVSFRILLPDRMRFPMKPPTDGLIC